MCIELYAVSLFYSLQFRIFPTECRSIYSKAPESEEHNRWWANFKPTFRLGYRRCEVRPLVRRRCAVLCSTSRTVGLNLSWNFGAQIIEFFKLPWWIDYGLIIILMDQAIETLDNRLMFLHELFWDVSKLFLPAKCKHEETVEQDTECHSDEECKSLDFFRRSIVDVFVVPRSGDNYTRDGKHQDKQEDTWKKSRLSAPSIKLSLYDHWNLQQHPSSSICDLFGEYTAMQISGQATGNWAVKSSMYLVNRLLKTSERLLRPWFLNVKNEGTLAIIIAEAKRAPQGISAYTRRSCVSFRLVSTSFHRRSSNHVADIRNSQKGCFRAYT